jgi:hypothetical protein
MIELLKIEWLKIKRYRTFWVMAILFLALLPLWNYGVANGIISIGGGPKGGFNILNSDYSFPQVWANLGFWGSWFITFVSILVIILTTNEYVFRTNRQNVIDGWSRLQFLHAKVWLVVALSVACTLYLFVLGALAGGVNSGSLSNLLVNFRQVGYFFLLCLDYLGFGLLLAVLIKRSGLAISLFLLYSLIIENFLRFYINHKTDKPWANLLPLQASDELLPFTFVKAARALIHLGPSFPDSTYVIAAIAWCVIYYVLARLMLARSDW